jgi:hypothetical protein
MNKRLDLDACKKRLNKAKSVETQAQVCAGAFNCPFVAYGQPDAISF